MIHIVAVLTAKMLAAFKSIVPAVHEEPGCIEYQAVVDIETSPAKFGADAMVVIEKWQDQAALDAHNEAPALKEFQEKAKHILAQVDVYLLQNA
jgi:quinol monooxygenase YgiN